jgi:predicted CXXCH cytochrome family protein
VNALCTSCHTDKTDGAHVTSGGHRVAGGPDTHEPDKDFSCVSCHSPHGSDSPKLLRYGKTSMEACDWCHGDRTGDHPELKDIHRVQRPKKPVNPENK